MKFCKFLFLGNFLALGDKIPEMGPVKSARKVYFFSLKIEKMQNNAKNWTKNHNFNGKYP